VVEKEYLNTLHNIMENGTDSGDRTGTGTKKIFGQMIRAPFSDGFPLLTTKKVYWNGIIHELLWFLSGDINIDYLKENNVNIWNANAEDYWNKIQAKKKELREEISQLSIPIDENSYTLHEDSESYESPEYVSHVHSEVSRYNNIKEGDLGPVYGHQWRNFNSQGLDQISDLIKELKRDPNGRRHIVTAWNPLQLKDMALPPCHILFQFGVEEGKYLTCSLYQRSSDMFLGVPFNIASYSLLTYMVAHCTGLIPKEFVWFGFDCHIYSNHFDVVREQLQREPNDLPKLRIDPDAPTDIFQIKPEHIILEDYNPQSTIKAKMAV